MMAQNLPFDHHIEKLNDDNYDVWHVRAKHLLMQMKLWRFVKNGVPEFIDDYWEEKDDEAFSTIGFLVQDNQLTHLENSRSAHEAWKSLRDHHKRTYGSNLIYLHRTLERMLLRQSTEPSFSPIRSNYFSDKPNKFHDAGENSKGREFLTHSSSMIGEGSSYPRWSTNIGAGSSTTRWIIHLGATNHMTNNKEFFQTFDSSKVGMVEFVEEDKLTKIQGVGSGIINSISGNRVVPTKLSDVLFAPSLNTNLLSVRNLAQKGYKIIFEENECNIINPIDGQVKFTAVLQPSQFYELNIDNNPSGPKRSPFIHWSY